MRTIERASAFKRDYKRVKETPRYRKNIDGLLTGILSILVSDESLPPAFHDHPLIGDWAGYRECHIKPDLLLIYMKPDNVTLWLVRLGSHSELFG